MPIPFEILASDKLVVRDRLAIRCDEDEWYLGSVTSVKGKKITVHYDYSKVQLPMGVWEKIKILSPLVKLNKRAFTDAEVAKMPGKDGADEKLKVKKTKGIKEVPTSKTPTKPKETPQQLQDREEKHLESLLGDASAFARAKSQIKTNPGAALLYCTKVWKKANEKLFDNKLRPCHFRFFKMTKVVRGLGQWIGGSKREMALSPRNFYATQRHCLTTLVHEMCHQATEEISHDKDRSNGGHGYTWSMWMLKCGLEPERYEKDDVRNYMSEEEKK